MCRFDEPEDEQSSLQLCQPLMERLVTTLGGSLCSTLMVAESLEIIAHTSRALAKLSDSNTTIQVHGTTTEISMVDGPLMCWVIGTSYGAYVPRAQFCRDDFEKCSSMRQGMLVVLLSRNY